MPIKFGGATSHRLDFGTMGAYAPTKLSWWGWVSYYAFTGNRQLFVKSDAGNTNASIRVDLTGTVGNCTLRWGRATTGVSYITNTTPFAPLNSPTFVVITLDSTAGAGLIAQMFTAKLGGPLVSAGYSTQTDGSGAFNSAAGNHCIGASTAGGGSVQSGQFLCWSAGFYPEIILTPSQMLDCYAGRFPRGPKGVTHYIVRPGRNGTGIVIDESGNGVNGTLSGAIPTNDVLPWPVRVPRSRRAA